MYIEDKSQEQKILSLLEENKGKWVSVSEIMRLGIACHTARITGLRYKKYTIENKTEYVDIRGRKEKYSWYRIPMEETPV